MLNPAPPKQQCSPSQLLLLFLAALVAQGAAAFFYPRISAAQQICDHRHRKDQLIDIYCQNEANIELARWVSAAMISSAAIFVAFLSVLAGASKRSHGPARVSLYIVGMAVLSAVSIVIGSTSSRFSSVFVGTVYQSVPNLIRWVFTSPLISKLSSAIDSLVDGQPMPQHSPGNALPVLLLFRDADFLTMATALMFSTLGRLSSGGLVGLSWLVAGLSTWAIRFVATVVMGAPVSHNPPSRVVSPAAASERRRLYDRFISFLGLVNSAVTTAATLLEVLRCVIPPTETGARIAAHSEAAGLIAEICFGCAVPLLRALALSLLFHEEREEEARLRTALDAEKAAADARRKFLREVFHEARGPLCSVSLVLDTLRREWKGLPVEEVDEMLTIGASACTTTTTILNGVLSLSSIESGKFRLKLEPASLRTVANQVKLQMRPWAEAARGAFTVDLDPRLQELEPLLMDAPRMSQLITNYVANALKMVPQNGTGRVELRITVEAVRTLSALDRLAYTQPDRELLDEQGVQYHAHHRGHCQKAEVLIEVTDNGPGVPADQVDKLFQPFETLSGVPNKGTGTGVVYGPTTSLSDSGEESMMNIQRASSTGLGLSIVKQIAEAHGGAVGVRPNDAQARECGATFFCRLSLPLVELGIESLGGASSETGSSKVQPTLSTLAGDRFNSGGSLAAVDHLSHAPLYAAGCGGLQQPSISPSEDPLLAGRDPANTSGAARTPPVSYESLVRGDRVADNSAVGSSSLHSSSGCVAHISTSNSASPHSGVFLVVDDDGVIRKLLSRAIRSRWKGACVMEAADGQEAVKQYSSGLLSARSRLDEGLHWQPPFAAILLDGAMPRMSGYEAAACIRKLEAAPAASGGGATAAAVRVPIIGVTGNALDSDTARFIECGADEVMIKPFTNSAVYAALEKAIR